MAPATQITCPCGLAVSPAPTTASTSINHLEAMSHAVPGSGANARFDIEQCEREHNKRLRTKTAPAAETFSLLKT